MAGSPTITIQSHDRARRASAVPVVLEGGGVVTVTIHVGDRLGRDAIGIELNPEYAEMSARRLYEDAGMFAEVEVVL